MHSKVSGTVGRRYGLDEGDYHGIRAGRRRNSVPTGMQRQSPPVRVYWKRVDTGANRSMNSATVSKQHVLDRLLDPVADVLTPSVARAIADLRADPATQARI